MFRSLSQSVTKAVCAQLETDGRLEPHFEKKDVYCAAGLRLSKSGQADVDSSGDDFKSESRFT